MVVGIPVTVRLSRHTRTVTMERILHIDIDRLAEALQLPVARHGNLIPFAHVVVVTLKAYRTRFRVFRPMKLPLTVKRHDFLTFRLL